MYVNGVYRPSYYWVAPTCSRNWLSLFCRSLVGYTRRVKNEQRGSPVLRLWLRGAAGSRVTLEGTPGSPRNLQFASPEIRGSIPTGLTWANMGSENRAAPRNPRPFAVGKWGSVPLDLGRFPFNFRQTHIFRVALDQQFFYCWFKNCFWSKYYQPTRFFQLFSCGWKPWTGRSFLASFCRQASLKKQRRHGHWFNRVHHDNVILI